MKTRPQPVVDTAAKAEAKAVSRPTRRMRSKGPLQTADFQKSPHPGGDPPYGHTGGDRLDDQDARGSGGVRNPPPDYRCVIIQEVLRVTLETMEEEVDMMSRRRTRLFILMMGQDTLAEDDPNPDGPHGRHSRMYSTMTINKWAKPIPKLDLPPRIHTQKASKIKQIWENMVRSGSSRFINMEFLGCPVLE